MLLSCTFLSDKFLLPKFIITFDHALPWFIPVILRSYWFDHTNTRYLLCANWSQPLWKLTVISFIDSVDCHIIIKSRPTMSWVIHHQHRNTDHHNADHYNADHHSADHSADHHQSAHPRADQSKQVSVQWGTETNFRTEWWDEFYLGGGAT